MFCKHVSWAHLHRKGVGAQRLPSGLPTFLVLTLLLHWVRCGGSSRFPKALLLTWHAWWLHPGCWRGHRIPPRHSGNAPYAESRTARRRSPWYQTWPKQTSRHLTEGPRRQAVAEQTFLFVFQLYYHPVFSCPCWDRCLIMASHIDLNMQNENLISLQLDLSEWLNSHPLLVGAKYRTTLKQKMKIFNVIECPYTKLKSSEEWTKVSKSAWIYWEYHREGTTVVNGNLEPESPSAP